VLPAASAKAIAKSLRLLVRDGLVMRTEHPGPPRRVEYQLTPLGNSLREPIAAIREWTAKHWDELLDAREAGLED
jgi:DNA-binding HxlR family transcriptional regulator